MDIVKYNPKKDYDLLKKWFKGWDWKAWNQDAVTPFSYFVVVEGKPVAFSGYYPTIGTGMALMGFTIGDPEADRLVRARAVDYLWDFLFKDAAEYGINYLYYSSHADSKHMINKFVKKGGFLSDNGTSYIAAMALNDSDGSFLNEEEYI